MAVLESMKHPSDIPTLSFQKLAPLIITPQGHHGRFLVGKTATGVTTSLEHRALADTAFYFSKSRQDLNLLAVLSAMAKTIAALPLAPILF